MAFVKLDSAMLNSSIWHQRDDRSVFVTALLMAEPFELADPMPQMEVRSLEKTGWVVPPGWYGFVRAAASGIIAQDGIEREAGLVVLEALGSPDPESRSPEYDGRRLVRISGGYIVLNYFQYRDRDHGAADRMRRLRERRKDGKSDAPQQDPAITAFERAWALYPKRGGGNSKADALKAWNARIHGTPKLPAVDPAVIIAGVERYAAYIRGKGDEGTEFVKQAATFFGPSKHWEEAWTPPAQRNGNSRDARNQSAIEDFARGE